jgi:lipoprotein-anchoring transpeptidase ErfK/SrfK
MLFALVLTLLAPNLPIAVVETPAAVNNSSLEKPAAELTPARAVAEVELSLKERSIRVRRDGQVYGPWPVAIGAPATPTPKGVFQVQNKLLNPVYQSPKTGAVNGVVGGGGPLGDRWIGFLQKGADQFGIHGTPWPWWVEWRGEITHGCVRMLNDHVRKLFDLVEVGSKVVVKD